MNVHQVGKGKPLVLLHSLLTDSSGFDALAGRLAPTRVLVMVDFPGYRGVPRSSATIPDVALGVAEMLAAKLGRNFDLLGNGYGGFVALSLAQQLPSRVERLILLDSAAAFPPEGKAAVHAMKEAVEAGGMDGVVDIALQRLFPPKFREREPDVVAACRAALLSMDAEAFASTCSNLIEVDLRPGLARVTAETLVIVGLEDKATPLPLAREVAQGITGAKLHELHGCGHAPHIQMPDATASLLQKFLL